VSLILFAAVTLQQALLAPGDAWAVERSYRYLNEEAHIDRKEVTRVDYRVESVDARGIVLSMGEAAHFVQDGTGIAGNTGDVQVIPVKLKLGPGGAPTYQEVAGNPNYMRVERIQWSAGEDRAGVSWTRKFPKVGDLGGAKLTMRPRSESSVSKTIAVTYEEGEIRGEATVSVLMPKRIVTGIKMTLTGVHLVGVQDSVKVSVNQTLLPAGK